MLKSGGSILDANPGSDLDAIQHHAQQPQCGSCHACALALLVSVPFSMGDTRTRTQAGSRFWTEGLFVERPERPQWSALA